MHTERTPRGRLGVVFTLLLMGAGLLGVRLAGLINNTEANTLELAARQQRMVVPLAARPGGIWLRTRNSYRLLAGSRQSPSCYMDPLRIADDQIDQVAARLADALQLDWRQVAELVRARRKSRFVWVKRDITDQEVAAVKALGIASMVGITHEWRRQYPNGSLAAGVLGFCLADGSPGGGLELSQRRWLQATPGRRVMLADASRRPIWLSHDESYPPVDGHDVHLTIDAAIQAYLEEALAETVGRYDAKWATGVVVEPATGRILAMASVPTFDPNQFNSMPAENWANRAILFPYEPGSAAKPIFAAAAVDAGAVTYDTEIFCENGTYHAHRGGRITDHGQSYGTLTVGRGVVISSNICLAKVGEMLGNAGLYSAARRFGFGEVTGIALPGEEPGIVRPLDRWDGYSTRRVPFGQELSVTALQLTMAFAALANGGLLMQPQLIDHITDPDGQIVYQSRPQVVRRAIRPDTAAATLEVLRKVVEEGTGRNSRMARWTSFGKTGTAQIAGVGGYVDGAYTGTFIGGGPVGSPRVICLVSVYWPNRSRGYYGSTVAAPYVRSVLERTLAYLEVPPDRPTGNRP